MVGFQSVAIFLVVSLSLQTARGDAGFSDSIRLFNAAEDGMTMPGMGIGTGAYGKPAEEWNDDVAEKAIGQWLQLGGRRIDTSYDYHDQTGIGKAIKAALAAGTVKREDVFITSKTHQSAGYNDTLQQLEMSLSELQVDYVDLFLIHSPGLPPNSSDPQCRKGGEGTLDSCIKSTWSAMQAIFKKGRDRGARAIGVSNFQIEHMELLMGEQLLPAVNQVEHQIYWHQDDLVNYCKSHNVTFNGYSPLGAPDFGPRARHWNCSLLELPLVKGIATAHSKSPAQVLLQWGWQQGIPVNPRSENAEHMKENIATIDASFQLSSSDMQALSNVSPKPACPRVCGSCNHPRYH